MIPASPRVPLKAMASPPCPAETNGVKRSISQDEEDASNGKARRVEQTDKENGHAA